MTFRKINFNFFKKINKTKMALFFAIVGPGIITANVDNDAGGITTYSLAGANFGYTLIWTLFPITLLLIAIQEMVVRMGIVTGKGLTDLIRERFGVKITFYFLFLLILTNFGNIVAEFAGIAASLELLGIKKNISIPISMFCVWWVVVNVNYKKLERIFLFACLIYFSYVISGILVGPNITEIGREFIKPSIQFTNSEYWIMLIGVIGTTIAPWMQFYQQAAIVEKGIKTEDYAYSRLDTIVGAITVSIVAFFIIVVCSETIHKGGLSIETAKDAAMALKPLAGNYCYILFAIGLLNASLFAACILPITTSFCVCEGLGWEAGVNKKFLEAPQFYILFTLLVMAGGFLILTPNFPLITIMYISQVINGLLLPVTMIFMLLIINDKKIMGKFVNSKIYNFILIFTNIILGLVSVGLSAWYLITLFTKSTHLTGINI